MRYLQYTKKRYQAVTKEVVVFIKEKKFKDYLGNKPKYPDKGHRCLWILWITLWSIFIITATVLFSLDLVYINWDETEGIPYVIAALFHSCVGAPIVEEILFRGYFYNPSRISPYVPSSLV